MPNPLVIPGSDRLLFKTSPIITALPFRQTFVSPCNTRPSLQAKQQLSQQVRISVEARHVGKICSFFSFSDSFTPPPCPEQHKVFFSRIRSYVGGRVKTAWVVMMVNSYTVVSFPSSLSAGGPVSFRFTFSWHCRRLNKDLQDQVF